MHTFCVIYLIRHVIDIKPHVPVPIVRMAHPKKDRLVKYHNILKYIASALDVRKPLVKREMKLAYLLILRPSFIWLVT